MGSKLLSCMSFDEKIAALEVLYAAVEGITNVREKLKILDSCHEVQDFLSRYPHLSLLLSELTSDCDVVVKSILAVGQGEMVFGSSDSSNSTFEGLHQMLEPLLGVEKLYRGGVIGYYHTVLTLLVEKRDPSKAAPQRKCIFHKPPLVDISAEDSCTLEAIRAAIDHLGSFAALYPVGGAAERLGWYEPRTGIPLSAATLPFGGIPLLEWLIYEIQAFEFLHWQLHGRQLMTPIALMTSHEKNNHLDIVNICRSSHWFGRQPGSFRCFPQGLVPVITDRGDFAVAAPMQMILKPGGHGVIWSLAQQMGIFKWFSLQRRRRLLLRQINNPIASTDYGLAAFMGVGCLQQKAFGFATCPRKVNAAEGMVVLREMGIDDAVAEVGITNIEYTDLQAYGIADEPIDGQHDISPFPANSNILYADLTVIEKVLQSCRVPGMLINMKSRVQCCDSQGERRDLYAGRLESTMQNIADCLCERLPRQPDGTYGPSQAFVTSNKRRKTLSVAKKQWVPGTSPADTVQQCYYDLLANSYELFTAHCAMEVPPLGPIDEYLTSGPPFIIQYHPALGPFYSIIKQKIRGGRLAPKAELLLTIADIDLQNVEVMGSLQIVAQDILGHRSKSGVITYSHQNGKCELVNVRIVNSGVDYTADNIFWQGKVVRHESCTIILHGDAEFYAQDVCFEGDLRFEVLSGHRMVVESIDGKIVYKAHKIKSPTWFWEYSYRPDSSIALRKRSSTDER